MSDLLNQVRKELEEKIGAKNSLDAEIKQLKQVEKTLIKGPDSRGNVDYNYEAVGEDNIKAVGDYLKFKGNARQQDIVADLGKNSGTISMALKVLEERKQAKPTGQRVNRSNEWKWVGKVKTVKDRRKARQKGRAKVTV